MVLVVHWLLPWSQLLLSAADLHLWRPAKTQVGAKGVILQLCHLTNHSLGDGGEVELALGCPDPLIISF